MFDFYGVCKILILDECFAHRSDFVGMFLHGGAMNLGFFGRYH